MQELHSLSALFLSPWGMAILGLLIGSFINAFAYRLPNMLRRRWARDAIGYLAQEALQMVDPGAGKGKPGRESNAADVETQRHTVNQSAAGAPVALARSPLMVVQALVAAIKPTAQGDASHVLQQLAREGDVEAQSLTLSRPHSACPACGHTLRWFELIPVLSWLWLRGRCSACSAPISPRYPLVEAFVALAFGGIAWAFGPTWTTVAYAALAAGMVAMALIDADTMLLPDEITQPLLWAGIVLATFGVIPVDAKESLAGAVIGFGVLWGLYWIFRICTGVEAIGRGDFPLLALIGAWLGAPWIIPVLVVGGCASLLGWCWVKAMGRMPEDGALPFGPYLVIGAFAALAVQALSHAGVEPFVRGVAHWLHAITL